MAEHGELKRGEAKVEDGVIVFSASRRMALCWAGTMPQEAHEVAFNLTIEGHTFAADNQRTGLRPPGLSAYQTTTAVRNVRMRRVGAQEHSGVRC